MSLPKAVAPFDRTKKCEVDVQMQRTQYVCKFMIMARFTGLYQCGLFLL